MRVVVLGIVAALGVTLGDPSQHNFTVDEIKDIDGMCPSKHRSGETCSLRQALKTIVGIDDPGPFSIFLAYATYKLTQLPPKVNSIFGAKYKSFSIVGQPPSNENGTWTNGTIIDGQGAWQLLQTEKFIRTNVSDILFLNGNASNTAKNPNSDGGAINNGGDMVVKRCKFEGNEAVGSGGAILSSGTLELEDVQFRHNKGKTGGALVTSGTIANHVTLQATNVIFENNSAEVSGALQNAQGTAT